ncbi:MAG: Cyanobacterial phytochrome [Phycisphaerales bacterium]|nr:Cyanobacterial phytochrome [Phycisphaerales bacterium]
MAHIPTHSFWRAVAQCLAGSIAVALLTFGCFHFQVTPATVGLLYLIAVVLVSLTGALVPSLLVSIIASQCMNYFFTEPLFSFSMNHPLDFVALVVFPGTALIVTRLISTRRRAMDVLLVQASLLNLTHDTVFVRDTSDVITYWNRGAEERYGWTSEEAVGQVSHHLAQTIFPAPLEAINAELLRTGRWEGELTHTRRDGTKIVVASRWALQRDQSGNPVSVLETNNDISERKRAEEQLRKLNDELEQRVIDRTTELVATNKELEAFTYSVSHDLRAPLRHMAGYTELIQKNAPAVLDEKSRRYMRMIADAAKRMGELIDDLLAFSRIGRAETQKTMVSLDQLVKEALSDVRQDQGGRDIVWRVGELRNVYGDRSMLRLALCNLVANAVKFTRTRPRAEIEIGRADGKADEIVVFIKDNGVGFEMKYVNKLFGVFQRLHRTEEFEGTGIGLATVQRIINRHGGKVWAEGMVDRGATFYFSVPKS